MLRIYEANRENGLRVTAFTNATQWQKIVERKHPLYIGIYAYRCGHDEYTAVSLTSRVFRHLFARSEK